MLGPELLEQVPPEALLGHERDRSAIARGPGQVLLGIARHQHDRCLAGRWH